MLNDNRRDSRGFRPDWFPGQEVYDRTVNRTAIVIEQTLDYRQEYPEYVWSRVRIQYEPGLTGIVPAWQLAKVVR